MGTTPRRALPEQQSRSTRWVALAAAATTLVAAGGFGVHKILNGDEGNDAPAAVSTPSQSRGEVSATDDGCGGATLAVDPAWAAILDDAVKSWPDRGDDACPSVAIEPVDSAHVIANGLEADGWVPEDPMRVAEAKDAALAKATPVVLGHSPLVVVHELTAAEALGQPVSAKELGAMFSAQHTWANHGHKEWGLFKVVMPDPVTTATGAIAFSSIAELASPGTTIDKPLNPLQMTPAVKAVAVAQQRVVEKAPVELVTSRLATNPDDENFWTTPGPRTGIITEALATRSPGFQATYLTGGAGLQLALVQPSAQPAVEKLVEWLSSTEGRTALAEAGVRSGDQAPSRSTLDKRGLVGEPGETKPMDAKQLTRARTTWAMTARRSATMFVLDGSGSMKYPMPGSPSRRIDAVLKVMLEPWNDWPPGMANGMMMFNTGPEPENKPQIKLVLPLQRNDTVAWKRNQHVYLGGLNNVPVSGGTPLHQAISQAYDHVLERYQDGMPNQVIVVTDGRSGDAAGEPNEDELIAALKKKQDPDKPVKLVIVALGEETDLPSLKKITDATGGVVLHVKDISQGQALGQIGLGA